MSRSPSLASGSRLGAYQILGLLGSGGMGDVYRAFDPRLEREVALKVLPAEVAADPDRLARFEREAKALAALSHASIVTVYTIEESDGVRFLTMELVEGETLDGLIPESGVEIERLFDIAIPLADALAAAHDDGVTHRDLKPANLMVKSDGRVKILDFGLAKLQEKAPIDASQVETLAQTRQGTILGTLPYMSPEQVEGRATDQRTDIFSLGSILYEMATGSRPFRGATAAGTAAAILRDLPTPTTRLRPDLPRGLDQIVRRCLHKRPEERYPTAGDLRDDLERLRKEMESAGSAPPAAATRMRMESLAVLPLANLSGDPGQEYFADGMTEALITDLARIGGLKVISRTSVMRYKDTAKPTREIARELGVDALVEGSVLSVGNRVRISAQLIRGATDEHLWAERYDRALEDVLELQAEVARSIAKEVDVRLTRHDESPLAPRRKVDPEVYRLVLQGRHQWNNRTEASFRAGLRCFQRAIDRDPTYAPAYVGLADCLQMLVNYGLLAPPEIRPRALAAARKALDLDPVSADAHRALALVHWQMEFDWTRAIEEYEEALRLDPNSALTTYWYGAFLGVIGRFEDGLELLQRAQELDPLSLLVPSVRGWVHYFARRFEDSVRICRKVLEIDPEFFVAHWFLGEALIELEDFDEGLASLQKALRLSGETSRMLGYLGYGYGRAGNGRQARELLSRLEHRARTKYVPPYFPALIHSGLGETERALDRLEEAYELQDSMIRDLKADPQWDRLHQEPRFQRLMSRMAFPEAE